MGPVAWWPGRWPGVFLADLLQISMQPLQKGGNGPMASAGGTKEAGWKMHDARSQRKRQCSAQEAKQMPSNGPAHQPQAQRAALQPRSSRRHSHWLQRTILTRIMAKLNLTKQS
ncbi:hypothetical protein CIHG_01880 [Coccidioides immitis H538.4]|uniref:Uncharacterized protein n=3 Tax=Coccidioides immitis TaxID=5501 RepID=A0A0J8R852_COCIT|nr:hypothetical protein CIRG_06203 [Coccidioides immitis RMSCC 2394]KMU80585.1 hypothetical protein CISG_08495 [Coccidioides immitis RMSCC 3703]KMU84094.1 hypothetical protein CIHG_01880 [Coccidioides immitis H538.4]